MDGLHRALENKTLITDDATLFDMNMFIVTARALPTQALQAVMPMIWQMVDCFLNYEDQTDIKLSSFIELRNFYQSGELVLNNLTQSSEMLERAEKVYVLSLILLAKNPNDYEGRCAYYHHGVLFCV